LSSLLTLIINFRLTSDSQTLHTYLGISGRYPSPSTTINMRRPSFSQVFVPILLANSALALPRAVEYLQDLETRLVHAIDIAKRATLHDDVAPYTDGANGVVSTSNFGGDPTPPPPAQSSPVPQPSSKTEKRASLAQDMAPYDNGADGVTSDSKFGDESREKRASLAQDMAPYDDGADGVLSNTVYGGPLKEKRASLAQVMEPYTNGAGGVVSTSHYGGDAVRSLPERLGRIFRARDTVETRQETPIEERMWDGSKPLPKS
jgi:hypothetical protein